MKVYFCPVCNSRKNLVVYKTSFDNNNPYNKFLINEVFDDYKSSESNLRFCLKCTLCFFDHRYSKKELDNLYSNGYSEKRAKYIEGFRKKFNQEKRAFKSRATLIRKLIVFDRYIKYKRWKNKALVLDFGGWHGENIPDIANNTMKFILDKSKHKTSSNVQIINQIRKNQKYDFIMSTHVFEHLLNPLKDLMVLNSALKKDGLIYLELPADIVGLLWRPPMYEHINYFSRNSIIKLANLAKLDIVSIEILKYPYSYHDTIAYIVVLRKLSSNIQKKELRFLDMTLNILKDIFQYSKVKLFGNSKISFRTNSN